MSTALDFRHALKQRGLRMTPQRQLILDAVASARGHISVDHVYQQVISQFPDVNGKTVYRTLEVLEELGLVRHTHFHDGVAQYQRTDEARSTPPDVPTARESSITMLCRARFRGPPP